MLSHIQPDGFFDDMYQHIHIDEKWFFLMNHNQKYDLLPDEKHPVPKAKSKWFIQKVIFLCTVAKPIRDKQKDTWFDEKIGI